MNIINSHMDLFVIPENAFSNMEELTEKGVIFIDTNGLPYQCRMFNGNAWLFSWDDDNGRWLPKRIVTEKEVFAAQNKAISEGAADYYYDKVNEALNQ